MVTGQCSCQPGVTGKQCDRCHHGFFGFSAGGCRGNGDGDRASVPKPGLAAAA